MKAQGFSFKEITTQIVPSDCHLLQLSVAEWSNLIMLYADRPSKSIITITPGLWKGLQSTHLASRAKAKTPAASGAAADVPEWRSVQFPYKSVVAWNNTVTQKTKGENKQGFKLEFEVQHISRLPWILYSKAEGATTMVWSLLLVLKSHYITEVTSHGGVCIKQEIRPLSGGKRADMHFKLLYYSYKMFMTIVL